MEAENTLVKQRKCASILPFSLIRRPLFPLWSPCNLNPSWRAATTLGWGAGHQDQSSVQMTSALELGFNWPAPWPHNRNSCRWDPRATSWAGRVGNLQVLRAAITQLPSRSALWHESRPPQLRWPSQPYHMALVPGIQGTVMSTDGCCVGVLTRFHCFSFSLCVFGWNVCFMWMHYSQSWWSLTVLVINTQDERPWAEEPQSVFMWCVLETPTFPVLCWFGLFCFCKIFFFFSICPMGQNHKRTCHLFEFSIVAQYT